MSEYNNVVIAHNIGWSGGFESEYNNVDGRESLRNIGRNIPTKGYQEWILENYVPLIDRGFRRFMIQNPAGANRGEDMDFDQFLELDRLWWKLRKEDPDLAKLSRSSYVDGWKKLNELYPDIDFEFIDYLGTIVGDEDMKSLSDDPSGWLWRAQYSVSASLDCGHRIAFDASKHIKEGSKEHRFIQLVESLGQKPLLEPWVDKDADHLLSYDVVMVNRPDSNATYQTFMTHEKSSKDVMTGQVYLLFQGAWNSYQEKFVEEVKKANDLGITCVIGSGNVWLWLRHFG